MHSLIVWAGLAMALPGSVLSQYTPYGSYFVLSAQGEPITSERLDPIMAQGTTPSNHVHEVYGGDKFAATWDYKTAQSSTCNNMGPKVDHSNYWFPALYFNGADGSFTKIPPHLEIYYHFDTADNGPRTMFPPGMKIVAGNAMNRHDDTATNPATDSIRWFCHGPDKVEVGEFPSGVTSCPAADGFAGEIWFPFCWDGSEDFDPTDPGKHVVYGGSGNAHQGGKCPGTHPTPLPQLFMEFHHDISSVANKAGAAQPWVLAQGDATGYGMHADFINGWETGSGSLADAIAVDPNDKTKTKCYTGESTEGAAACFSLLTNAEMSSCSYTSTVKEEVQGPLKALPGCNPIQSGPQDATMQTNCAGYTAPTQSGPTGGSHDGTTTTEDDTVQSSSTVAYTHVMPTEPTSSKEKTTDNPPVIDDPDTTSMSGGPAPSATSISQPASSGSSGISSVSASNGASWPFQGCYSDLIPDRSIRALSSNGFAGSGKSPQTCVDWCISAGYKIAGIEFGWQCYCGNQLKQSQHLDQSKCNMPCTDTPSEICGGSSALSVYAADGTNLGLKRRARRAGLRGISAHPRSHQFLHENSV